MSPARNRVTPTGEIVAIALRGAWTRTHDLPWSELADGTFVLLDDVPAVVVGEHLTEWTVQGYGLRRARPRSGRAAVLTPPSSVAALRAGYQPQIDPTAR